MSAELPEQMTCIEIPEPGGYDALKPGTRPVPAVVENEVLIKVAAAGVNHPDLIQRRGVYPPPPGITDIPGLEIAGTIAKLGPGVTDLSVGDAVVALVAGGGYAEYCVAPAPQVLPMPKGLSAVEAAAIPETFFTVWTNVYDRCAMQPGETLLVHGGASGIGTTAIMMGTALGNQVIATAGTAEKCDACRNLGALRAINYKEEDFVEVVREVTDGHGVDVILDMVGGDYFQRNIDCLAPDGRLVIIALLGGRKAEIDFGTFFQRRLTITGSTLRPRPVEFKGAIAHALQERVWPHIEAGKIRPVIQQTLPLTEAAEAHRLLEEGNHVGKFMLSVG
jgi:NADPH2:quinone reductase